MPRLVGSLNLPLMPEAFDNELYSDVKLLLLEDDLVTSDVEVRQEAQFLFLDPPHSFQCFDFPFVLPTSSSVTII